MATGNKKTAGRDYFSERKIIVSKRLVSCRFAAKCSTSSLTAAAEFPFDILIEHEDRHAEIFININIEEQSVPSLFAEPVTGAH
jgi:hypothetical protein